ncbi:alanine racemase [Terracoccus luteus]|uniref:Alanine racemase n=1 Tax=Terracoccus luteus TaxID=53356 RepID=A0A839PRC0_9MICO|nr:alanine racemase [Terracoccus luteus]MBB2985619.1 alanine racemase [Terracoccus luteus]MCP2171271.1 alanine racemase [Terracoccus luteus]
MSPTTAVGPALPAWAEVDLGALAHNVGVLRHRAPGADLMAVVKADAYGHGLVPVARTAVAAGAAWLGVAQLAEAFALRDAGVTAPVLSWLSVPGSDFAGAVRRDVDLSASAPWALDEIAAAARAEGRTARVHLKVDSGLGRGGAYGQDWTALVRHARPLEAEGVVRVVGVWTHFAFADAPDHPTVLAQQERFFEAAAEAEREGCRPEVRHLANSAATLVHPAAHADLVRPGLALYGLSPVPQVDDDFGLRPVMTLRARLALVKGLPAGQGVSYGHAYVTPGDTVVGLVPAGYGDGVPRNATNVGPVLVGDHRTTVAGRVCMDQFVVDLGPDSTARAGDVVTLFGGAPGEPTAQQWADATGTISYEIVTRIGPRVPRVVIGSHAGSDAGSDAGSPAGEVPGP